MGISSGRLEPKWVEAHFLSIVVYCLQTFLTGGSPIRRRLRSACEAEQIWAAKEIFLPAKRESPVHTDTGNIEFDWSVGYFEWSIESRVGAKSGTLSVNPKTGSNNRMSGKIR